MTLAKQEIRKQAREKRRLFVESCSKETLEQLEDQRIKDLFSLDSFKKVLAEKGVIGVYSSFKNEASTNHLIRKLECLECTLALPRLNKDTVVFHEWHLGDPLEKSSFGMLEPKRTLTTVKPDLCIVPLLAFDSENHRLGYGRGHYDHYLSTHPNIIKIGWAYECQYREKLPPEPHDIPLDHIIF